MSRTVTTLAPGVRIRHQAGRKDLLEIEFRFRGVRCKEILRYLDPAKKASRTYAINLKAEIQRRIAVDGFNYAEYFPDSKRARLFGHGVSTQTVDAALAAWLKDVERVRPHSTLNAYRKPCDLIWRPALGELRLVDLQPEHIREAIRSYLTDTPLTVKTWRNYLLPLRQVLEIAVADDVIQRNPLDAIRIERLVALRPAEPPADPYTPAEIATLLAGFAAHRPGWLNYFTFMFYSGLRPSEAYALTWAKVDQVQLQVRIDAARVERQDKDPKTRASARVLPLLPQAWAAIAAQRAATQLAGGEVFWNPRTGRAIRDYEESAAAWDYVHTRTGVRRRAQYQTRHTFASNLLSEGTNMLQVADWLGHRDLEMLLRVYAKYIEQGKEAAGRPRYGQEKSAKKNAK